MGLGFVPLSDNTACRSTYWSSRKTPLAKPTLVIHDCVMLRGKVREGSDCQSAEPFSRGWCACVCVWRPNIFNRPVKGRNTANKQPLTPPRQTLCKPYLTHSIDAMAVLLRLSNPESWFFFAWVMSHIKEGESHLGITSVTTFVWRNTTKTSLTSHAVNMFITLFLQSK